jgi:PIN domain nuclease of toxin-antitoxin system
MMFARTEHGQVLILMAAWLFFAGGASSALVVYDRPASETKKAIKRVIIDDERKDEILSYISYWESVQKTRDKKVSADREQLLKTLRRKDAQRSELEPIMAKLDATFVAMDRDFLDLRFRLKGRVTSAEWADIVARVNR